MLVVALGVILSGVALLAMTPAPESSFGWFAEAPSSDTSLVPDGAQLVSTVTLLGSALVALGSVGLAFFLGLILGSRRSDAGHET